jgi:protein phosphatase
VNQDQFLIADLRKSLPLFQTSLAMDDQSRLFSGSQGKLLLVADGMGGAATGERASTLVVDSAVAQGFRPQRIQNDIVVRPIPP